MPGHTVKLITILAVTLIIANCDAGAFVAPEDSGGGDGSRVAAAITMDSFAMVAEDDSIAFNATVLGQDGQPIPDAEIEWSSSDTDIAYVNPTGPTAGVLVAQEPGTATITASYGEVSTSETIEVHKRPVDLVYVTGSGQRGDPGTELPNSLAVRVIDKRGDAVSDVRISFVVASGGGTVSPQAGTTDAEGRLSAAWTLGTTGQQVVEARASAAQARVKQVKDSVVVFTAQFTNDAGEPQVASVSVSPPNDTVEAGATTRLQATVRDADGNELTDRTVAWSSSDTTVAAVDEQGVVAGMATGHIAALAKVDGVSGAADITVADPARGALTIASSVDTLLGIGTSATFTAEARAADGSLIPDPDVQWTSSNPDIATVDSMGIVIARALGVTTIAASAVCCDSGAFVDVTVVDGTVGEPVSVIASPSSHRFTDIEATAQISATARDSEGNIVNGTNFTYSSTNPTVVSVDEVGNMMANELGTAAIIVAAACCVAADTVQAQVDTTAGQPLFEDDFGTGDLSHSDNGYSWTGGSHESVGTTNPRSGSHALEILFNGDGGTDSDGFSYANMEFGDALQEVWVEAYVYIPDNYKHRSSASSTNNKFFQFWAEERSNPDKIWAAVETHRNSDYETGMTMKYDTNFKGSSSVDFANGVIGAGEVGAWNQFRFHVKMGTYDNNDGVMEVWWNGALILSAYDVSLYQDPNGGLGNESYLRHMRVMGWSNSGFDADTRFDWDDIKVYDSDPGWEVN